MKGNVKIKMYYPKKESNEWYYELPTIGQISKINEIVEVIPEAKNERDKCTNKGECSRFIDKYINRFKKIKKNGEGIK